ncbi:hypothetical protein GALMADRAFT_269136 [Galerina marginata CBS 339.88]|uniref:Heterokaryon incompatibility domain-containing protein n=1 Tax=Galerina marginata (strain CBS 339.88) TaxID=685588 RepID=A0A067SVM5_GALM3|nr:hypothetical protein GALMADRAFT_269136 [Galerina marginata CBS 339.88]
MPLSERRLAAGENPMDWESESDNDEEPIEVLPLLPIPLSLAKPNDNLCDTCKALELTPSRFAVLPDVNDAKNNKASEDNIKLGFAKDVKERSHTCPLCRLVLKALAHGDLPDVEDGEPIQVTISWNTDGPKQNRKSTLNRVRCLRPRSTSKNLSKTISPEITLLANDAPTPSKSLFSRVIGDQIDFSMVRNWLAICKTAHGDFCDQSEMLDHDVNDPATEIPTFRLIDVVDNCVVHAPYHSKYVALSYVWGNIDISTVLRLLKSNLADLEKPGSLLQEGYYEKIPVTIRDAIQVVRELHLRYLWTDSLCIVQDDDDEQGSKYDAMAKMDFIYGAAHLTIVAATGNDANTGLPGVREGTRGVPQSTEEIAPGFRLALRSRHQDCIPHTIYSSRGWTYQEQMFSTRKLTFIGGQVMYSCWRTNGWREDVVTEDQHHENRDHFTDSDSQEKARDDIGRFEGLISAYSGRSLTFQSDIYNAFAGMAHYFKTNLEANLCHGIPDKFFDWFLLWKPQDSQTRRKDAPSWSWSGWQGASSTNISSWLGRSIIESRYALRTSTWVIWYQRKAHDSTECVLVWTPKSDPASPPRSPRNFYGSQIEDDRFLFDCTVTAPTPMTLTSAPTYIKDSYHPNPGSGFLQFWTVSAMFRIAKPTYKNKEPKPTNGYPRVGIFGEKTREVGFIFVHPRWRKKHVPGIHEFILICEGGDKAKKGHKDDDDDDDDDDKQPKWRYMVMLIEWHDGWAERVALGWIKRRFLKQALNGGPVWKEIILG